MSSKYLLTIETSNGFIFGGIAESMYGVARNNVIVKITDKSMVLESRGEGNTEIFRTELFSHKFNYYDVPKDGKIIYMEFSVSDFKKIFKGTKKKVHVKLRLKNSDPSLLYIFRKLDGKDGTPKSKLPLIDDVEPCEYDYPKFDESNPIVTVPASEFNSSLKTIYKTDSATTKFRVYEKGIKISSCEVKGQIIEEFPYGKKSKEILFSRKISTKTLINVTKCCKLDKFIRIYAIPESRTIILSIDVASNGVHNIYLLTKKKE